jgi:branched-chain amino acid transport system ATP-binding protein
LTVVENLELGSYNPKAKTVWKTSFEKVNDLFPILKERNNQIAGTLSGGEQQILAIGRGLMFVPELLMLDESSLGLSPIIVRTIFAIVKEISKQGTTVSLVEQDIYTSLLLCENGYVMESGKIVLEEKGKDPLENGYIKKAYLGI